MTNLELVLPEIFLSLSIMFLLILGVFKKESSKLIQNISLIILLITAVITFNETLSIDEILLFNDSIIVDMAIVICNKCFPLSPFQVYIPDL